MAHSIEKLIAKRFEEIANILPSQIPNSDDRVKAISGFLGNVEGLRVLDVGCGKGRFLRLFNGASRIVGMDVAKRLLMFAKSNEDSIEPLLGTVTAIALADSSFDAVVAVELIEHVPDVQRAVSEMLRVLKTGGKVVIIDKNKLAIHHRLWFHLMFFKSRAVRGAWMYNRSFPFTERWFMPRDITLSKACQNVSIKHLGLSFLSLFIIWTGIKK